MHLQGLDFRTRQIHRQSNPPDAGTEQLDLGFSGQWTQSENALAWNWRRHYGPTTGRYTKPDPLRFVDGTSLYAYVGGSPLTIVDFLGLAGQRGERGASGGISGKGTDNPYKHCREDPDDPDYIICRHHQAGKPVRKKKPQYWNDYKFCIPDNEPFTPILPIIPRPGTRPEPGWIPREIYREG